MKNNEHNHSQKEPRKPNPQVARWRQFSEQELRDMAMKSKSRSEFGQMMGYPRKSGAGQRAIKQICQEYDIDISHWRAGSYIENILPLSDIEIRNIYENSNSILEFGHAITNQHLNDAYVYKLANKTIKHLALPPKNPPRSNMSSSTEELLRLITSVCDYQELSAITGLPRNVLYSRVSRLRKKYNIETPNLSNRTTLQFKNGRCYRDLSSETYIRESRLFAFLSSQGITTCSKCHNKVASTDKGHVLHIDNDCYNNNLENLMLLCTECFFNTVKKERAIYIEPLSIANQDNRGIYIIINLENSKIYVGMTTTTFRQRIQEHLYKDSIPIDKVLQEKGTENFVFGILENMNHNTKKEISRRERYWIEYYHSNLENIGYNCPSAAKCREAVTEETVLLIHELLLTTTKSYRGIAQLCHVDSTYVSYVNFGKLRKQPEYHYPLRKRTVQPSSDSKQQNVCQCGKKIDKKSKACVKCSHKEQMRFDINRCELEKLILTESFVHIGEIFGVSDNAIRKRARKFGLPTTRKEIEEYKKKHHLTD